MFIPLAFAVSVRLKIIALAFAPFDDSMRTKFFLAIVNGLMACSLVYANIRIICREKL